jgi:glycosyltransferase involved in cell wall biosynthesis
MKDTSQHNSKLTIKNVAIVVPTFKNPCDVAPQLRVVRFASVLAALAKEIFIVTGNFYASVPSENIRVINVKAPRAKSRGESLLSQAIRFLAAQFTLSTAIVRLSSKSTRNLHLACFFSGEALLMPVITCKFLGIKVVLILRGSLEREMEIQRNPLHKPLGYLKKFSLILSDKIIVGSSRLTEEWTLGRYRNKISIAPYPESALFTDSGKFRPTTPLVRRANVIGYVGRLSREKGILNFIQAMPRLFKKRSDLKALIVGDGELQDEIEQYVKESNLNDKVKLVGRVSPNEVPRYLNELKLLVIASYSEGFPSALLEAMACGTPVLATPVGAITDVIADSETGFIMEDNSPECIVSNVTRALKHPNLEKIAQNASTLMEREFTYQAAVERYRDILASLNLNR